MTIDGREVVCSENARILDVARREQIFVPTLCWDERLDPYKASHAALAMLKYNYEMLGTWPLALTAFLFAALLAFIIWTEDAHIFLPRTVD